MTTLFTDAFGTGALDDNWNDGGNSFASYSSGQLVFSGEGCIVSKTSLGTGNKWMRFRLSYDGLNTGPGFGDSSGNVLMIGLMTQDGEVRIDGNSLYSSYTSWQGGDDLNIGTGQTDWTTSSYIGVTFDPTAGTFRLWQNVTAETPTGVNEWDGGAAEIAYTPAGSWLFPSNANYAAFGSWTGSPGTNSWDDLTAGDFSAGGSNVDITSGVGALTASGKNPALDYGMPLSTGDLTLAGNAPTRIERGLRYAYPTADVSDGTWLPSTGTDLYTAIDEDPASDTDYIYTNAAGACEIRLLPVTDPASSSGYALNYRIWSPVGGNAVVRLKQGATTIATWTHTGLPTTPTDYSQALSGAEADSITDHDDLRIEIEAT